MSALALPVVHRVPLEDVSPVEITCRRVLILAFKQALHVTGIVPDILYPHSLEFSELLSPQLVESSELVSEDLTEEVTVLGLGVNCKACLSDISFQGLELSLELVDFVV